MQMPSLNEHYGVNEGMSEGKNLEHHKRNGEPTRGKGEVLCKETQLPKQDNNSWHLQERNESKGREQRNNRNHKNPEFNHNKPLIRNNRTMDLEGETMAKPNKKTMNALSKTGNNETHWPE